MIYVSTHGGVVTCTVEGHCPCGRDPIAIDVWDREDILPKENNLFPSSKFFISLILRVCRDGNALGQGYFHKESIQPSPEGRGAVSPPKFCYLDPNQISICWLVTCKTLQGLLGVWWALCLKVYFLTCPFSGLSLIIEGHHDLTCSQ